jgi:hypothetical protein
MATDTAKKDNGLVQAIKNKEVDINGLNEKELSTIDFSQFSNAFCVNLKDGLIEKLNDMQLLHVYKARDAYRKREKDIDEIAKEELELAREKQKWVAIGDDIKRGLAKGFVDIMAEHNKNGNFLTLLKVLRRKKLDESGNPVFSNGMSTTLEFGKDGDGKPISGFVQKITPKIGVNTIVQIKSTFVELS